VTSPDERADNSARNAAIKIVDAALKSGRIVQADHDMRVSQLRGAQTMQDIDMAVRDLRAASPEAPPTIAPLPATATGSEPLSTVPTASPTTGGQQWPLVNYGPGSAGGVPGAANVAAVAGKSGRAIGGIVAAVVLVSVIVPIAGAVIAFVASRNALPDFGSIGPSDDTTYLPGQAPGKNGVNLHTVEGYDALVDAIKDETGQTYVFNADLYPRYAVVEVPTGTNTRYEEFYWDGEKLAIEDGMQGTTDDAQIDLSLVDPQQIIDMLTVVRGREDTPTSWYAIVDDSMGSGPQISTYASNEFSESNYLIEKLDGTVVYDSEKPPS
jgi:hypothetical protein